VRANIRKFLEEVGRESENFGHAMRVRAVIIVHRTKLCAQLNCLREAAQKHGCILLDAAMHLGHRNRKMTVPLNNVYRGDDCLELAQIKRDNRSTVMICFSM